MKITLYYATVALLKHTAKAAAEFTALEGGDYGNIVSVNIDPPCPCGATSTTSNPDCRCGPSSVPNTMFTITPAETAQVLTDPPNLFTTSVDNGILSFRWNDTVAATASSGGVQIKLPAANLESVSIHATHTAQVLDGFTKLKGISATSSSNLQVTASLNTASSFTLMSESSATVKLVSNVNVDQATVGSTSTVDVQAPKVETINVNSVGTLSVDGDVGGGSVESVGRLIVTGDTTGTMTVSSAGIFQGNTISGKIDASSASQVYAASCSNVVTESAASCQVASAPTVSVIVTEQAETLSGTYTCNWWCNGAHAAALGWTVVGSAIAVVLASL